MPASPPQPPVPGTLPHLLLVLTAICGEFPSALVSRLPGGTFYKESMVTRLKAARLLRTYYRNGLRGLRLTASAKKFLLSQSPEQFQLYLTGSAETNHPKSEITRRLRLHRMAEVLVMMLNANVSIFQAEKPALFSPSPPPTGTRIDWPAYYSSRELKEMGDQTIKVRGSRATGILLTAKDIFAVYNAGTSEMQWEYRAEMRLKALLQIEVCQRRLSGQYQNASLCGLVFGAGMDGIYLLLERSDAGKHNYFILDGNYDHFYYLPNDHFGEVVLRLLCYAEQRATIDQLLKQNLSDANPGWPIEHDAIDEDGIPVLFAYTCDLPRIHRFCTALSLQERSGSLICFDFQTPAMRRICGRRVTIQSLDFEKVEALMEQFEQEER